MSSFLLSCILPSFTPAISLFSLSSFPPTRTLSSTQAQPAFAIAAWKKKKTIRNPPLYSTSRLTRVVPLRSSESIHQSITWPSDSRFWIIYLQPDKLLYINWPDCQSKQLSKAYCRPQVQDVLCESDTLLGELGVAVMGNEDLLGWQLKLLFSIQWRGARLYWSKSSVWSRWSRMVLGEPAT